MDLDRTLIAEMITQVDSSLLLMNDATQQSTLHMTFCHSLIVFCTYLQYDDDFVCDDMFCCINTVQEFDG